MYIVSRINIKVRIQNYSLLKLTNGRVVTWGDTKKGGDSRSVQYELQGVDTIYSTDVAFAAKLVDSHVVTWDFACSGGQHKRAG